MKLSRKGFQMNLRIWLGHTLFNIGFWTFFWGAFELAYQSPSDPIWSGAFGFPIPHHYIIGAILAYIGYIMITFTKSIRERIKREVTKMHTP
jgi:hypothetical protein